MRCLRPAPTLVEVALSALITAKNIAVTWQRGSRVPTPHLADMHDWHMTFKAYRDEFLQINFPWLRLVPDYLLMLCASLRYTHTQTLEDVELRLIATGLLEQGSS